MGFMTLNYCGLVLMRMAGFLGMLTSCEWIEIVLVYKSILRFVGRADSNS